MLNKLQKAGFELMQSDARFVYTIIDIFENAKNIDSNYMSILYVDVFTLFRCFCRWSRTMV